MPYKPGSKVDRTPTRSRRADLAMTMGLEMLDLLTSGDEDKSLVAKAVARWLDQHKRAGTMTAEERKRFWYEVAGALGVQDYTYLIKEHQ